MAYYCWQIKLTNISNYNCKSVFLYFLPFSILPHWVKIFWSFQTDKTKESIFIRREWKFPHVVKIYNSMKAASVYISNYTFQNLRLCFHKIYIVILTVVWGKDLLERTHFEKFWSFALFCKTDLHFFRTRKVPCWDFEIR